MRSAWRLGLPLLVVVPLTGCSLVTVPVKAAADVADTAIRTTGDVLTAPFGRPPARDDAVAQKDAGSSKPTDGDKAK